MKPDRYPMSHVYDAMAKQVYTKMDLIMAYHQIHVAPELVPKTAIINPFRCLLFIHISFGHWKAARFFLSALT